MLQSVNGNVSAFQPFVAPVPTILRPVAAVLSHFIKKNH